jgi:signal transduction histidine kinase
VSSRKRNPEFYDSAFGLPDPEARAEPSRAPTPGGMRAQFDSASHLPVSEHVIAVSLALPAARASILATLGTRNLTIVDGDHLADAALFITEAAGDVRAQLADIRTRARPDAAILLVLAAPSPALVSNALAAGAFACIRPPIVPEEVLSLVTAALDSKTSRVQVADLTRKLDLQAHLASIGRMSAGLSHEISSPLGAAIMSMETVQEGSARLLELLESIVRSSPAELPRRLQEARAEIAASRGVDGLIRAVEDTASAHARLHALLETMRDLRGNSTGVRRELIDLRALAVEVQKWVAADLHGVEVELLGEPVAAVADGRLVGQIVQNLTANAAHAARSLSSPRVRLHVYAEGNRAVISVRDNGPGIAPDLQERIFEPFFTTRRAEGGTGLGLALCREYALQMGAELSLWSMTGRGTCFRLHLPRAE